MRVMIKNSSRWVLAFFCLAVCLALVATPLSQLRTRAQVQKEQSAGEANDAGIVISAEGPRKGSISAAALRPNATASIGTEAEPNDTSGTATPLGTTPVRVRGDLYTFPVPPLGDVDYYSFTAGAGDKVYAATMTFFSGGSGDTNLDILDTNGSSVLENDNDDGSFGSIASVVAGRTLPAAGTYFVQVFQTCSAR